MAPDLNNKQIIMQETWQILRVGWAGVSEWFRGFPDWSRLGLVILAANGVGSSGALELLLLPSSAASFTAQFLLGCYAMMILVYYHTANI